MKATRLNIVWNGDVRFAVAVRPAHGVAQIAHLPRRRRMVGKRSRTLRIANPLPDYELVH